MGYSEELGKWIITSIVVLYIAAAIGNKFAAWLGSVL